MAIIAFMFRYIGESVLEILFTKQSLEFLSFNDSSVAHFVLSDLSASRLGSNDWCGARMT